MAFNLDLSSPFFLMGSIAVLVAIVFLISLLRLRKRFIRLSDSSRQENRRLANELQKTNKQLVELRSIAVGLGQSIADYRESIDHLEERIYELEQEDKDARLYSRATKMVKLGADINELIDECEIPKAEAELMLSLQNKLAGKEPVPPLSSNHDLPRRQVRSTTSGRRVKK